jgi:hypothetical protein
MGAWIEEQKLYRDIDAKAAIMRPRPLRMKDSSIAI